MNNLSSKLSGCKIDWPPEEPFPKAGEILIMIATLAVHHEVGSGGKPAEVINVRAGVEHMRGFENGD
jgi:hypothetical protein